MRTRRGTPGRQRVRAATTVVAVAVSALAIGPANADRTRTTTPAQAAPAVDPALLSAIRRQLAVLARPQPTPRTAGTTPPAPRTPARPAPTSTRGGSPPTPTPSSASVPAAPGAALAAYVEAAAILERTMPSCRLPWALLAGIGTVESDNGQYGGSTLGVDSTARPSIIGIRLDGSTPGTGVVHDTDHGRLDGDPYFDRAVGPMQFLPGTWTALATSATPGHVPNPQNIADAALTAGIYLCESGNDLSTPTGQRAAVLRYNNSASYADTVLGLAASYGAGTLDLASVTGAVPHGGGSGGSSGDGSGRSTAPAPPTPVVPRPVAKPKPVPPVPAPEPPAPAPAPKPLVPKTSHPKHDEDASENHPTGKHHASVKHHAAKKHHAKKQHTTAKQHEPATHPAELLLTADSTVRLVWGSPATATSTVTSTGATGYLATLQVRHGDSWQTVQTSAGPLSTALRLDWTVPDGVYRVTLVTVDDAGRGAPLRTAAIRVGG